MSRFSDKIYDKEKLNWIVCYKTNAWLCGIIVIETKCISNYKHRGSQIFGKLVIIYTSKYLHNIILSKYNILLYNNINICQQLKWFLHDLTIWTLILFLSKLLRLKYDLYVPSREQNIYVLWTFMKPAIAKKCKKSS